MDNQPFSLVRAVPGMQSGARGRNLVLVLLAPTLVLVWPFVAAYAVGTDRGASARALRAVPGVSPGGGSVAAVAAFTWTALALAVALAPLAVFSPASLSLWLTLALPVLYLLAVGYGATRSVELFGAWRALRASGTGDPAPGPIQLSGTAEPVIGTVDTPFSETESIAHVSGRYRHTGAVDPGTLDSSTWGLTDRDAAAVPFRLGDGVLVDATPEAVTLERSRQSVVGDGSTTPTERLPDEVGDDTVAASAVDSSGPVGFVEQRVEPGEEVTVSGVAVPGAEVDGVDADTAHDLVITDPASAPERLVGDVPLPLVITDDASNAGATDLLKRAGAVSVVTVLLVVPVVVSPLPARLLGFLGL